MTTITEFPPEGRDQPNHPTIFHMENPETAHTIRQLYLAGQLLAIDFGRTTAIIGNPQNDSTVQRLYQIKERSTSQPFSAMGPLSAMLLLADFNRLSPNAFDLIDPDERTFINPEKIIQVFGNRMFFRFPVDPEALTRYNIPDCIYDPQELIMHLVSVEGLNPENPNQALQDALCPTDTDLIMITSANYRDQESVPLSNLHQFARDNSIQAVVYPFNVFPTQRGSFPIVEFGQTHHPTGSRILNLSDALPDIFSPLD